MSIAVFKNQYPTNDNEIYMCQFASKYQPTTLMAYQWHNENLMQHNFIVTFLTEQSFLFPAYGIYFHPRKLFDIVQPEQLFNPSVIHYSHFDFPQLHCLMMSCQKSILFFEYMKLSTRGHQQHSACTHLRSAHINKRGINSAPIYKKFSQVNQ